MRRCCWLSRGILRPPWPSSRPAKITERSAYRILADLQRAGYVQRRKLGRQNAYEINPSLPLRDPTIENERVRDLLSLVRDGDVEGHRQPHRAA
jgi:hypothetical protein